MAQSVAVNEYGEFTCVCGNNTSAEGAYPCDAEGNYVEPYPDTWPGDLYKCDRCGIVFDGDTGEIVKSAS